MTKIYLIIGLLFLHFTFPNAEVQMPLFTGILTETNYSAETLVKDYFIKGTCRNVDDITSFGNDESIGFFSNGESTLGFESGIILSTGKVKSAEGHNSSTEMTTSFNDNKGDPDLDLFASNVIFDATGIEFDFVPLGETVTFRYVFASEEYCEFVGSIFNDLFGFFVSGPGIEGPFENQAMNVAVLPGTNEYVTINNVNHNRNQDSYIQNERQEDARQCGIPFNPSYLELIEFDGLTIPLTATIDVIPCEKYHIRLVIGDIGDDKLDSAVFLESKSFDLGGTVTVRAEVEGSPEPYAYETCRDGMFIFERQGNTDINQPLDVFYQISPISSAEEGLDFSPIPGMITIPAQQNSYELPIEVIADEIPETPEVLRLNIEFDCQCQDPVDADLFIADLDSLQGAYEEIYVCANQSFEVNPKISGGARPYEFMWNTGATGPTLFESVDEPTHFTAIITDACGDTATTIVGVDIQSDPIAVLTGDTSICGGDTAILQIDFEGFSPWSFAYKNPDGDIISIVETSLNPYSLRITEKGDYALVHFEDAHCIGEASGEALVLSALGDFEWDVTPPTCPNTNDGQIVITIVDAIEPVIPEWDIPYEDPFRLSDLAVGSYTVTLTDGLGCRDEFTIEVPLPANPSEECLQTGFYIPNVFSPNQDGQNDVLQIFFNQFHSIQQVEQFQIFSRWGDLILEIEVLPAETNTILWDGKDQGQQALSGVYLWRAILVLNNGEKHFVSGDVTILY